MLNYSNNIVNKIQKGCIFLMYNHEFKSNVKQNQNEY